MTKIIKEIFIMLLVCLVGILLFAVALYNFIPNRKVVPEIKTYSATEKIEEMKADDVDKEDKQVVLTYKVTSSDLNTYKATKSYVPGKENPFSAPSNDPETGATTKDGSKDSKGRSSESESGSDSSSKSGTGSSSEENIK